MTIQPPEEQAAAKLWNICALHIAASLRRCADKPTSEVLSGRDALLIFAQSLEDSAR